MGTSWSNNEKSRKEMGDQLDGRLEELQKRLESGARSSGDMGFVDVQRAAFEAFQGGGLPRFHDESWKYTNPISFIKKAQPLEPAGSTAMAAVALGTHGELDAHHVLIVDGELDQNQVSRIQEKGLTVSKITEANEEVRRQAVGLISQGDGFQHLALSFMKEALYVEVAAGVKIEKPVMIHFVDSGVRKTEGMYAPICFVSLGEASSLQVIEHSYCLAHGSSWLQPVTSYRLGASSKLELYKMMAPNEEAQLLSFSNIQQAEYSHASVLSVMSSGKILRNILNVEQSGKEAFCRANGLSLVKSGEHFDVRSRFLHKEPSGASQQLYKSVVSERARFVFNGKIFIAQDAQRVDSKMLNKNLLLGRLAEADTKPELEVYADDVKAGHGASVGQLDVSELFYLMSRGISKRRSLELLARAYMDELLLDIPSETLKAWINARLAGQLKTLSKQIEASLNEDVTGKAES